jgi:hypothetical protein
MGWLREGMNGLVVLASGILTFGAGLYKDLALGATAQKIFFVLSAVALLATILCGVFCSFWLNRYANLRENDRPPQQLPADRSAAIEPAETRQMPAPMRSAQKWYYRFYYSTLSTFCASMLLITTFLLVGVFTASASSKDKAGVQPCSVTVQPAPPSLGYSVAMSARHIGPRGAQVQHTFLLDQSTGKVWQMACHKGGQEVEFRRIHVEGLQDLKDVAAGR